MKIYTKTGDHGMTGLYDGSRVSKDDLRIEFHGTIDELNSFIGLVRDQKIAAHSFKSLVKIQKELFVMGAELATIQEKDKSGEYNADSQHISSNMVSYLEKEIDQMTANLSPMTHFILPGGHPTISYCHIARCVCRRAERLIVRLQKTTEINPTILIYLNRLSDYLFTLARKFAKDNHVTETKWIP